MKVGFASNKDEYAVKDCRGESFPKLEKMIKKQNAPFEVDTILMVLDALVAAPTLRDLPPSLHPHPLKSNLKGMFAIDLSKRGRGRFRMILKPTNPEDYIDGDFSTITEITVEHLIYDYH